MLCCYLGKNTDFTDLLLPYFEEAANIIYSEFGDLELVIFGRVNYKSDKKICERYNVCSFPNIACIKNKSEIVCTDSIHQKSTDSILVFVRHQLEMFKV